jgi:hypothetical protein
MKTIIALSLVLAPAAFADPLDGREFDIMVSGAENTDRLIFRAGRLESAAMRSLGSPAVAYRAHTAGGAISFTATAKLADGGVIRWSGEVSGDSVRGMFVSIPRGESPIEFRFTGTR